MQKAFIHNRTEELGKDIWDSYILPLYFHNLGLHEARKSVVLEGGRGCGKTALLRYLSFNSQFSKNRSDLPRSALNTVGLYLKADPQYFSAFDGGGVDEKRWQDIFEHALCLALVEQFLEALLTLNCSQERIDVYGKLDLLNFSHAVGGLSKNIIPDSLDDFNIWIKTQRHALTRWFKNPDENQPPELYPLREFLLGLINYVREKLEYFSNTVFAVYIDEYENLHDYQQRFLNTLIKAGEPPLIFHIAMKPNGMRTRMTIGTEAIQDIGDYRKLILDNELEKDFDLFAAELFFFRLIQAGLPENVSPVSRHRLQDESQIEFRIKNTEYRDTVLSSIRRVLPGVKNYDSSLQVLEDTALYNRWEKLVSTALAQSKSRLSPKDFFDKQFPEATVVCASILHQTSKSPDTVLEEFNLYRLGQKSKFKEGEWIHHFLMGTLFLIYLPLRQRPCLLYSGFDVFVKLSRTNVRHFLELCHLSIGNFNPTINFLEFSVPLADQAEAAFNASRNFKEEVSGSGDMGNRLLSIVNFLGKLFRLSQGRPSQSEPERTHFSITNEEVSPEIQKVLDEAIKWSVLFKEPESKVKGVRYESSEYILNPIYAPFFGISFNKGRKLEIPCKQAEVMFIGNIEGFTDLLKQYEKQWSADTRDQLLLNLES